MIAMFIGDECDERTMKMGIRTGQSYGVCLYKAAYILRKCKNAELVALVKGHYIPYESLKAFERNWRVIEGKKVIN